MTHCCVLGCHNNSYTAPTGVGFHRLPFHNPSIVRKWLKLLRDMYESRVALNSDTFLCSEHFTADCFENDYSNGSLPKLRQDAIPTIFPANHNQAKKRPQHSYDEDEMSMEMSEPNKKPRLGYQVEELDLDNCMTTNPEETDVEMYDTCQISNTINHDHTYGK